MGTSKGTRVEQMQLDVRSFLGVAIGDNGRWLSKDLYEPIIRQFKPNCFMIAIDTNRHRNVDAYYLKAHHYPGPFLTREQAETWLTWAKVTLA